jgi:hypothetical protein
MRCQTPGHIRQQTRTIGAAVEQKKLFEIPALARRKLEAFSVHDCPQLAALPERAATLHGCELETPAESGAGREGEHPCVVAGRRQREQTVVRARAFRGGHAIVFGVRVLAEVNRGSNGAAGLRQHLESFAVERGRRRQRELSVDEHNFLQFDRRGAVIDNVRATHRSVPFAHDLDEGVGPAVDANAGV